MRERSALSTILVVVIVLVVIIVGTVAFAIVSSETTTSASGSKTSTSSSSSETSSEASSSAYAETVSNPSQPGVELTTSINTTTVLVGHSLNIEVGLSNSLPESNNVSVANDWVIQGFPIAIWGPCDFGLPVEFVVVSGNYSAGQLQQMTVNASQAEVGYVCMEGGSVKFIDFQAESSKANLTGTLEISGEVPHQPLGSYNLESNFSVSGYWNYPLDSQDSGDLLTPVGSGGISFQYPEVAPLTSYAFVPGAYTLAVADEWGQLLALHFTVEAMSTTSSSATCVQLESEPLFLIIRNSSSGSPISSLNVRVSESTPVNLCLPTGGETTRSLGTMVTDTSGTIEVCCTGSTFSFTIPYLAGSAFGGSYQSTANGAESAQCVTLYLPSGMMYTTYAPQFQDRC